MHKHCKEGIHSLYYSLPEDMAKLVVVLGFAMVFELEQINLAGRLIGKRYYKVIANPRSSPSPIDPL